MGKQPAVVGLVVTLLIGFFGVASLASGSTVYFSSDSDGQTRITTVNEGQEIWICVTDPAENLSCDVRDKIWADVKVLDPNTGAYIVWSSYKKSDPAGQPSGYVGRNGDTTRGNYLEETGADTGHFVSNTPFRVGARENPSIPQENTHVVGHLDPSSPVGISDFQWGDYAYDWLWTGGSIRSSSSPDGVFDMGYPPVMPSSFNSLDFEEYDVYLVGRFENQDTLVGMFQDPVDHGDVAVTMAKIASTRATLAWDRSVYKDQHETATITISDPDENLNANQVEYVPVFVIVNPGSWNPVQAGSPNSFFLLEWTGGVDPGDIDDHIADVAYWPLYWYDLYDSGFPKPSIPTDQPLVDGSYYIQYPTADSSPDNVTLFATSNPDGVCRVMFYAQETGPNTGVFQLNLNDLAKDLGFKTLHVHDTLAAYYLDPNDPSDFHIATAAIGSNVASPLCFTDAQRNPESTCSIGRDSLYLQVVNANANVDPCCPQRTVVSICDPRGLGNGDVEWAMADEASSDSPIFFTDSGMPLVPVWDALGIGEGGSLAITAATEVINPFAGGFGGFQLWPDNGKLAACSGDTVYARYNDVMYASGSDGLAGLGDGDLTTAFPPKIASVQDPGDVSFAQIKVSDTQVTDGAKTTMHFLNRQGNRVSGYVSSDCVFVEVVDPDQNQDSHRRERISAYWDGGQNYPFGPLPLNQAIAQNTPWLEDLQTNPVNVLLGDASIFPVPSLFSQGNTAPESLSPKGESLRYFDGVPYIYVLNPRNGRFAAADLLETGVDTGAFVSVTCIDLASVYASVPNLAARPGDTILAVYEDPNNHRDSAWISIKVGEGGASSGSSTATFRDAQGDAVSSYSAAGDAYVRVVDPSHAGASRLLDAVSIDGKTFDLEPLSGASSDTFVTKAIPIADLGAVAGETLTATYTDPTNPTNTATATATITAAALSITDFYAGPNPFSTTVHFAYHGSGIASDFTVAVYDLSGNRVWSDEETNTTEVRWDGTNERGQALANGPYIYVVMATDGTHTFHGKGMVFIKK